MLNSARAKAPKISAPNAALKGRSSTNHRR
jgi:hypothetical protein